MSVPVGTVADVFQLHAAGRIEPLAQHLAEVLGDAPADPMQPEWLAVPSEGMRRWLHLELARHLGASADGGDGVAANLRHAFPGQLRQAVLDAGRDPDDPDPWRVERMVWSLFDVVVAGHAPLGDLGGTATYARARRVADLFDRYHVHRADMVRAWAHGDDVDGAGRPLPEHHRWQPRLWRALRERIGAPSPPERIPGLLDELHAGTLRLDLPDRLCMFGLSLLPGGAGFLDLADAVGTSHDLHLFFVEPSPWLARRLTGSLAPPGERARTRAEDPGADQVAHPLVRSWGRLHRETTVLLVDGEHQAVPPVARLDTDGAAPATGPASTLLGQLQRDVRADRAPGGELVPDAADRTVQLHAAYGATRQVEVLRDVLVHLLADEQLDPTEDDVVVVCPQLERFAPLISSVLGPSTDDPARVEADRTLGADGAPALRYRIADRSLRSTNPLLDATESLLSVVGGRFDAPSVLDLIGLAPVRRRFGWDDDAVATIGDWVAGTGVRWGLDARRRARLGIPEEYDTNTWRAGVDRLLLGLAVDDEDAVALGGIVPVASRTDDARVAGQLAALLSVLDRLVDATSTRRPVHQWCQLVRDAVGACCAVPAESSWQLDGLNRVLAELTDEAADAGGVRIDLSDLRRLLAERLAAPPGRADFFRGGVTISSLTPLRWVPYRVVVALGMDQHAFAAGTPDGDDLAAAVPLVGDRDGRGEVRQALLELVLSARERLVVIREGRDVRTNHVVPRAVPVAELADAVLATVHPDHRDAVRRRLEVVHPRQAHDERVLVADARATDGPASLDPGRAWAVDPAALDAADARRRRGGERPAFLERPIDASGLDLIELSDLHDFLENPVRHFLRRRLGVSLPRRGDAVSATLPVDPVGLVRWGVGSRLLEQQLEGGPIDEWRELERRSGVLPPGSLGDLLLDDVTSAVGSLQRAAEAAGVRPGHGELLPVDVTLADGTRVVGSVEDHLDPPSVGPVRTSFSKARTTFLLAAWLDLVALAATGPQRPWRSVGIYPHPSKRDTATVYDLTVADASHPDRLDPRDALEVVVDCYRRGAVEPLPLFPRLSQRVHTGEARPGDWRSDYGSGADGNDAHVAMVFGHLDLRDLAALPRFDDDPTVELDGWGRVGCYSRYLWQAVESSVVDSGGVDRGAP